MRSLLLLILCVFFSQLGFSQNVNPDVFKANMKTLYESAKQGFKDIKTEEDGQTSEGQTKFKAARKVSGADEVYISVDEETTHTYHAHFTGTEMEDAEAKLLELVAMMEEVLTEFELVKAQGTDLNFHNYRKYTFEFDSDNIDLLGKYPTFAIGILRDSDPPQLEIMVNEPLWK